MNVQGWKATTRRTLMNRQGSHGAPTVKHDLKDYTLCFDIVGHLS